MLLSPFLLIYSLTPLLVSFMIKLNLCICCWCVDFLNLQISFLFPLTTDCHMEEMDLPSNSNASATTNACLKRKRLLIEKNFTRRRITRSVNVNSFNNNIANQMYSQPTTSRMSIHNREHMHNNNGVIHDSCTDAKSTYLQFA